MMAIRTVFDSVFRDAADVLFEVAGQRYERFRVRLIYISCDLTPEPVELIQIPEQITEEIDERIRKRVRRSVVIIRARCCSLALNPQLEAQLDIDGEVWAVDQVESHTPHLLRLALVRPEPMRRYGENLRAR